MIGGTEFSPALNSSPAKRPDRTALPGRLITLVPLDPAAHAESLYAGSHRAGSNGEERERLWRYLFDGPFPDRAAFDNALREKSIFPDAVFFAILENANSQATGFASYMRMEPRHRVMEVGGILFTPALQRTAAATEAMYLMAKHAFEDLGYRRYEWKCDALNAPSRSAALRLGFSFEGIFRQHMIVKGRNRDTAWFSMLDTEWPARKANLERWLDASNFDANGRQKTSLSHSNATAKAEAGHAFSY